MKLGDKIYCVPVGALLVAALWWYVSSRKKGGEESWSALKAAQYRNTAIPPFSQRHSHRGIYPGGYPSDPIETLREPLGNP